MKLCGYDNYFRLSSPTIIFEDDKDAIDLPYNSVHYKRTKHINVRFHSICEKMKVDLSLLNTFQELDKLLIF